MQRKNILEAARSTSVKLHEVLKKPNIFVKAEHVIRAIIRNLYNKYTSLKKESQVGNTCFRKKEKDLQDIFDIAKTNVPEENLVFL